MTENLLSNTYYKKQGIYLLCKNTINLIDYLANSLNENLSQAF